MNTFPAVSDEALLIALIRKLRIRKVVSGGRTAPEGTHFDSLFATAVSTSLFKQKEFDGLLRTLTKSGVLTLAGRLSFNDGETRKLRDWDRGRVSELHPDTPVCEHQFFTENWTPIVARYSNDTGRRIYPHDEISYHRLKIEMVHVTTDGLPRALLDAPVIYPVA